MSSFIRIAIVTCFCLIVSSSIVLSHSGGLDQYGGHYNRKTGEYHYHQPKTAHPPSKETLLPNQSSSSSPKVFVPPKQPSPPPKEDNTKWLYGLGGIGIGYGVFRFFNRK